MTHSEQKAWLKDYIERWETNEQESNGYGGREPSQNRQTEQNNLIDELEEFCEENELPKKSADELLAMFDGDYLKIPATEANADIIRKRSGYEVADAEDTAYFVFNSDGNYISEQKDGSFHAQAYNEDEIFDDLEKAFNWLKERL